MIEPRLNAALGDTPVVFLEGPRQAGKSTLVREILDDPLRQYLTLDDPGIWSAASADPVGFVAGLPDKVTVDEVQRAPELLRVIEADVDRDRRPGRFLLTGSAHALLVPQLAEALVGRVEIVTLHPLAQVEIEGRHANPLDDWLTEAPTHRHQRAADDWMKRATTGGFPEVVARSSGARRRAWFQAYLRNLLQRDVVEISRVEGLAQLPNLLRLLAARSGGLTNFSEVSRAIAMPQTTVKRYIALLEAVFAITSLPAWSANLGKRIVRSAKVYVADPGILAHLLGGTAATARGALFEAFVLAELRKLATVCAEPPALHHFRTHDGTEVDFVLELQDGRLLAVEAKATSTLREHDAAGLRRFADLVRDRLHRGILLYAGDTVVPLAANLHAVPVSALW